MRQGCLLFQQTFRLYEISQPFLGGRVQTKKNLDKSQAIGRRDRFLQSNCCRAVPACAKVEQS